MTQTILLVEDNAITRKMLRFVLESRGFDVTEAPDGVTALESVRAATPDLVLLDLVLPGMDGFAVARRLRSDGFRGPLLALSGLMQRADEARLSSADFDDVIIKPVEPSRLRSVVDTHLAMGERGSMPPARRGSVVLADDDPVQRKLAKLRLTRRGYDVRTAADGAEALSLVRADRPDAIVSDVMMPELDGFGLCRALRADPSLRAVPIVLVTSSYLDDEDQALARRMGADAYVIRTPSLDAVLDALDELRSAGGREVATPDCDDEESAALERARMQRIIRQLERQVDLNKGLTARAAAISAELTILHHISAALTRDSDLDSVLDTVLAACFDAGGISRGSLYVIESDGALRARAFGASHVEWLEGAFSSAEQLRQVLGGARSRILGPQDLAPALAAPGDDAGQALLIALMHREELLGALLLVSSSSPIEHDRLAFAEGVANQIALSLALTRTFAARVASERAAREQSQILRWIFDEIAEGIVVVDGAGRFTHWNHAASEVLAVAPQDATPHDWPARHGLYHADGTRYEWEELPLVRAMRGEIVEDAEIYRPDRRNAPGTWLAVNARPLFDEEDQPLGALAVMRDVAQERTGRSQALAAERMASVGLVAAGVAHEINNPLAAAATNVELANDMLARLGDTSDSAAVGGALRELLEDASHALHAVRDIVRDLRIFSRSEEERREPIDVIPVLESSIRMASNQLRHRASLVRDMQPIASVLGNDARLGQVFLNLLVNAAQALPEGRAQDLRVTVRTAMRGTDRVTVEISDTGSGMSSETLERLFSPFFTTKPDTLGTGLGLSICHRIVSELGGAIEVESELGSGSTFRVVLPATERRAVAPSRRPRPSSRPPASTRVLVLDDDPSVGRAIARSLSGHALAVVEQSPRAALDRIDADEPFDVIVCDLMMPTMTGEQFYAALTARAPDLAARVVFLTGGAFTPSSREFLDRVPNPCMEKPFAVDELRARIAEVAARGE